MDRDMFPVSYSGSTGSRLQRALQVYKAIWDEFYIQEVTYCEDVIKGCERPTNHPYTEIQGQLVDHVPPEFHLRPRKDDELLEDFTVEQFDVFGNPELYSTMYCLDASKGARRPYSYATYESCTPGSRNEINVDPHCGALAFIPYADDESFKIYEYISYFDLFAWQSDFPDPDWELIELEVMTRLVLDCDWRFTMREVDELRILRKSRMGHSSGLLWDTSQR
ncbi:hypothetical protein C0993_009745 [Termitomyces sp. T159_Od127]|nr:hypothetical protein C0993_009745 [Termitomyces sp. T159_Od127]